MKFNAPDSATRRYVPPDMLQLYSITDENFLPKILNLKLLKSLDLTSSVKKNRGERKKLNDATKKQINAECLQLHDWHGLVQFYFEEINYKMHIWYHWSNLLETGYYMIFCSYC